MNPGWGIEDAPYWKSYFSAPEEGTCNWQVPFILLLYEAMALWTLKYDFFVYGIYGKNNEFVKLL